jgi:hypothetical protein
MLIQKTWKIGDLVHFQTWQWSEVDQKDVICNSTGKIIGMNDSPKYRSLQIIEIGMRTRTGACIHYRYPEELTTVTMEEEILIIFEQ